ncbi:MAG: TraU family protein [Alphaproteobacteria bacterium]|nr:TraU family protein [Alphaproteobacteria bacterium]
MFITPAASTTCSDRFVNPITNIRWSCLFPISIGPVNISRSGRKIQEISPPTPLHLPKEWYTRSRHPIGFWEPARLS